MKWRGILYSAPMVKAKLSGTKTETRRAISERLMQLFRVAASVGEISEAIRGNGVLDANDVSYILDHCPYGQPGDGLYGKETFQIVPTGHEGTMTIYRADGDADRVVPGKWKPSIFMPRKLSRILDIITEIRVERLRDISEEDAIAEGIETVKYPHPEADIVYRDYSESSKWLLCPVSSYRTLWESINGPGSWDVNPWLWVVTTKHYTTELKEA